jgi:hypothetical protein
MGAVNLEQSKEIFVLAIGIEWAIALPLLIWYSRYQMDDVTHK